MLEMLLAKLGIPLQQAQSSYLREWPACLHPSLSIMFLYVRSPSASCNGPTTSSLLLPILAFPAEDMQPRYRNSLGDRLTSHAAAFKLGELCVRSFQLQVRSPGCRQTAVVVWPVRL